MKAEHITHSLSITRMVENDLDTVKALCDEHLGKNLYSREYLSSVLGDKAHYFYLLVTQEREIVGYMYYFLTDLEEMSAYTKLPREKLNVISKRENPIIANLQSVVVAKAWQKLRLSKKLARFFLEDMQALQEVDTALCVCWKLGDSVPLEKTLKAFDFIHLSDAQHVWYDNRDLICPYCEGACECEAAVYYKNLRGTVQ